MLAPAMGRATRGEHAGMWVQVEHDESGTGWHIWLTHEERVPTQRHDIWADDVSQVFDSLNELAPEHWHPPTQDPPHS